MKSDSTVILNKNLISDLTISSAPLFLFLQFTKEIIKFSIFSSMYSVFSVARNLSTYVSTYLSRDFTYMSARLGDYNVFLR